MCGFIEATFALLLVRLKERSISDVDPKQIPTGIHTRKHFTQISPGMRTESDWCSLKCMRRPIGFTISAGEVLMKSVCTALLSLCLFVPNSLKSRRYSWSR
jgi:hypothetical protein